LRSLLADAVTNAERLGWIDDITVEPVTIPSPIHWAIRACLRRRARIRSPVVAWAL
jgi:hypothetical protein